MTPKDLMQIEDLLRKMGSKSLVYHKQYTAQYSGQTDFPIGLISFDSYRDAVWVYSGRTHLSKDLDYTVTEDSITLHEGVPQDRTIDIYVLRNVMVPVGEILVSGTEIAPGSIPLDRLDSSDIGGKMHRHKFLLIAEEDGQTEFTIPMENFDAENDAVWLQVGTLSMFEGEDFTIEGNTITLAESIHKGATVGIYVVKQVIVKPNTENEYFSGKNIAPKSIPLDRLASSIHDGLVLIKHDVTGEMYRLGLDNNGLYTVKYEEETVEEDEVVEEESTE